MKRFFQRLTIAGMAALVLVLSGCDLTEMNTNPNQPTEAAPPRLLANAQATIANTYWRDYPAGFWMRYAQYLTTNQYTDGDRYTYPARRSGSNNGNWEAYYLSLNDLQEVIRINNERPEAASAYGSNNNQKAMAMILQAWTYQVMTDMWGPIPFTQALQGRTEGNFTPAYTSQPEVYTELLAMLTEASNMIDASGTALAGGDLMFGGDMSKWKWFANALKMRVAMRMSDVMPGAAETAINEAIQAGAISLGPVQAVQPFSTAPPYRNPFFENYEVDGRDDWAAPEGLVGVMNSTDDPRRAAFFTDADPSTPAPDYNGFPYGLPGGEASALFTSASFSRPGLRVRQADAPAIFMLYDEVLFIAAEAKLRGWGGAGLASLPSAQELYRDAIASSLRYWGVTDQATISNFISGLTMPTPSNYEQVLGTQKWVAQYMQGVQGWSTWRRLDFSGVLQVPKGNPGQSLFECDIAIRMSYPTDEASLNQTNLQDAISNLLGGDGASEDNQGVRLWWDTNAPVCN